MISELKITKSPEASFRMISLLTFIVYLICCFLGWFNFLLAKIYDKIYYPLRSYVALFDKENIANLSKISKDIFNLGGYKALIDTSFPYKLIDDFFFLIISISLIVLFFIGYRLVKTGKINQTQIIIWSFVFSVIMTLSIPSHSSDLFGYIARGAQQSVYHQNPYLHTVSEINNYKQNPLFFNFMWPKQPTTYGTVFIFITKTIVSLSNNDLLMAFLNFKLLNLIIYLFLVLHLIKHFNTEDIYLIAWNPLLLIQGLWNCHNDLISGMLIFFGIYYFVSKSENKLNVFVGMFCLTLACGIKYVSLLILPFIIVYLIRNKFNIRSVLNVILGFVCGCILITVFSIDYITFFNSINQESFLKISDNINLVHKSLIATIFTVVKYLIKFVHIEFDKWILLETIKYSVYSTFAFFYFYMLFKAKQNFVQDIALILIIFFGFTIAKFHSWYWLNVILLIPMLEKSLLRNLLITLSITHVFAITFLDQAKILNFTCMTLIPAIIIIYLFKQPALQQSLYKKLINW